MIHVVGDTTVYRADPKREKAAFQALISAAHAGHLTLHIPEIVNREFISQQRNLYAEHIGGLITACNDLKKRLLPDASVNLIGTALKDFASLRTELAAFAADEFSGWLKGVSAVVHPIHTSHGGRVVEAYFAGEPPFREAKRRDDFPDAFLWQTILDLAKVHHPLYLVSSDKGIHKAALGVGDLIVFGTLEEFVASAPFQELRKAHSAGAKMKSFLAFLPDHLDLVSSTIANSFVDELSGNRVESDEIPSDNADAIVLGVGHPDDLELDIEAAVDHGDGLFVVPFSLQTEASLDYAIFKADYYGLPEERSDRISVSELNDHYYSAEESYTLRVKGLLSVKVDAEALKSSELSEDDDDALGILEDATISVDSISDIDVVG